MFTIEIKINGTMIGHVYGINKRIKNKKQETKYYFEYYKPETRSLIHGNIFHNKEEKIEVLLYKIFNKITKNNI